MSEDITTIKIKDIRLPKGVYICPRCGGSGVNLETGWISISPSEIKIKPSSKCLLCDGCKYVTITPFRELEYNGKESRKEA